MIHTAQMNMYGYHKGETIEHSVDVVILFSYILGVDWQMEVPPGIPPLCTHLCPFIYLSFILLYIFY